MYIKLNDKYQYTVYRADSDLSSHNTEHFNKFMCIVFYLLKVTPVPLDFMKWTFPCF